MQLMLCILGTPKTNTVTGQVYECVGRFVCPCCGKKSDILEFDEPVEQWSSIRCRGCNSLIPKPGRYSNKKRFIPLNDPDAIIEADSIENVEECTT
jgi:hypothetical protein